MRNLPCRRVQVDELWTFNYCKQRNITQKIAENVPAAGSIWLLGRHRRLYEAGPVRHARLAQRRRCDRVRL